MFGELITSLCLLKLHVIRVYLAFWRILAIDTGCIMVTNAHSINQMAFREMINYRFKKSVLDFLIVIMGVFRLLTKLFSIIARFRFGWDFPSGAVLGILSP